MNKKSKDNGWGMGSWKGELLLSFIGTTLSIIFTFGTSSWLDNRQKKENGRVSAIMIIHDINNTIDMMKETLESEEKIYSLAKSVLDTPSLLDSLSNDTLESLFRYLTPDAEDYNYHLEQEIDRLSSFYLETRKDLDNIIFLDNVQDILNYLKSFKKNYETELRWQRPLSGEEFLDLKLGMILNANKKEWGFQYDYLNALKKILHDKKVQFYILSCLERQRYLLIEIELIRKLNNKNKFLLGISEEELIKFIEKTNNYGLSVNNRNLIGTWYQESGNRVKEKYTFEKNNRLIYKMNSYWPTNIYKGDLLCVYTLVGNWTIVKDSLKMVLNPQSLNISIDTSGIKYSPNMKDSVKTLINYHQSEEYLQLVKRDWDYKYDRCYRVRLGNNYKKMEWTKTVTDESDIKTKQILILDKQ